MNNNGSDQDKQTTAQSRAAAGVDSADRDTLLHELEVHALELERNNQELRRTRSELEALKDRYLDLYDFAPMAYFTLDVAGVIRDVNLAGSNLLGLPRERLVGREFADFVDARLQSLFLANLRSLSAVAGPRRLEFTLQNADRKPVFTQLEMVRVPLPITGAEDEFRLIASDIGDRKRLEEQRRMFFTITSHELRTPVTNLILSLDMVLSDSAGKLDSDLLATLEVALRGARRLGKLVEDILQLRDICDSKLPTEQRRLDLAALMDEAVVLNRPYAAKFDVHIEVTESLSHAWIYGHEGRLLQVFNNLLTNAIKHAPEGGRVRVRLELKTGFFRVSVCDQGAGVDPELGKRVFQPFTQGEPSLEDDRNKGSLGLGLSVAQAIINQLGGSLDFDRKQGVTTFYFELPASSL